MANNDSRSYELELVHTSDDAYLFTDGDDEYWLPRSLVQSLEPLDDEGMFEVTIPEWLAVDRGLE